jgi:putative tricarboxylic transport membrane protein
MTRLHRRTVIAGGALAGLAGLGALPARAQAVDTLKIFVPAAPGGGWDQTGRAIEQAMKGAGLVKNCQFTHKGGAGGTVGLPEFVNQWKGQSNALMVGGMVMVGAIIANKSAMNLSMVTPIAALTGEFEVIAVPANSPIKSMKELAATFKAGPEKVSWAGGSAGGTDHILVGMIAKALGVEPKRAKYVAYAGGGPAVAALLGGHVTAGVSGYGEFAEQIKAGKLRALAISADKRVPGIETPTLKEEGVDVELFNWRGVFAPGGISADQRTAMLDLVTKMAKSPQWAEILKKQDWTDILVTGDAFKAYVDKEMTRIGAILADLAAAK